MTDLVVLTTVICAMSAMIEDPDAAMLLTPEEITTLQNSLIQLNASLPQPVTCPKPLIDNDSNNGNNGLFESESTRHTDSDSSDRNRDNNEDSNNDRDSSENREDSNKDDNEKEDLPDCKDDNRPKPGSCTDSKDVDECEEFGGSKCDLD